MAGESWRDKQCKEGGQLPFLSLFTAPLEDNHDLLAASRAVLDLSQQKLYNMKLYASTMHPNRKLPTNSVFFFRSLQGKREKRGRNHFKNVSGVNEKIQQSSWKNKNRKDRMKGDIKWNAGFEGGHFFGAWAAANHGEVMLTNSGLNLVAQTPFMNQNEFDQLEKKLQELCKKYGPLLGKFLTVFDDAVNMRTLPDDKETGVADAFGAIAFYLKEGLPAISGFLTRQINDINQTDGHVVAAERLSERCSRVGESLNVDPFQLNQVNPELRIPILLTRDQFAFVNELKNSDYDETKKALLFVGMGQAADVGEEATPPQLPEFRKAVQFLRKVELYKYYSGTDHKPGRCLICTDPLIRGKLAWRVHGYVPSWSIQVVACSPIHYECLHEIEEGRNLFMTFRNDVGKDSTATISDIGKAKNDFPRIKYYAPNSLPANTPAQIPNDARDSEKPSSSKETQGVSMDEAKKRKCEETPQASEPPPPPKKSMNQPSLTRYFHKK